MGMTQMDLGAAVDSAYQQIQKYECGTSRVPMVTLYRIAYALRVPLSYFFEGLPPEVALQTEAIENPAMHALQASARELAEGGVSATDLHGLVDTALSRTT